MWCGKCTPGIRTHTHTLSQSCRSRRAILVRVDTKRTMFVASVLGVSPGDRVLLEHARCSRARRKRVVPRAHGGHRAGRARVGRRRPPQSAPLPSRMRVGANMRAAPVNATVLENCGAALASHACARSRWTYCSSYYSRGSVILMRASSSMLFAHPTPRGIAWPVCVVLAVVVPDLRAQI
jgi:hypothetical protein